MGFGGIGIWQLLIVLAIILLVFGTKRLRNLGGDVGGAIKGFKNAMKEEDGKDSGQTLEHSVSDTDTPASAVVSDTHKRESQERS